MFYLRRYAWIISRRFFASKIEFFFYKSNKNL